MFRRLMQLYMNADLATPSGRAVIEERYWSLRRQVPIVYLLGFVNLAAMEVAATGSLSIGLNHGGIQVESRKPSSCHCAQLARG